jgi:hypothetical protein
VKSWTNVPSFLSGFAGRERFFNEPIELGVDHLQSLMQWPRQSGSRGAHGCQGWSKDARF